jgi:two-component system phosphate regulon sensor histidine kinase PhoR
MVQELGDLARIEGGQVTLDMKPFSIGDSARQVVERLKAQSDMAGLSVKVDVAADVPLAWGDMESIERVLVNIVHNAIKFTPAGGTITISAGDNGQSVIVSVADTGVGVPADDLPRIFERFYKADRARSGGGTGLGLAIAKHIVEAHKGRIWAESVEGQGSTFSFVIPAAPQEDAETGQAILG